MTAIKRILVATDFSDCARNAVDYALSWAERLGAELDIVHVFERPVYFEVGVAHRLRHDVDQWIGELKREMAAQMDALITQLKGRAPTIRSVLKEGAPGEEILKTARDTSADLIVMGTHGRSGLSHALIGSVAERVVRQALCPVLTVPSQTSRPKD